MPRLACFFILLGLGAAGTAACDKSASDPESPGSEPGAAVGAGTGTASVPGSSPAAGAAPAAPTSEAPAAPDIIVDRSTVAVGADTLATGEPALADKIGALLVGKPAIQGQPVSVVAMRNAKPSQVGAVVGALRAARATGATIKTSARDDSTQTLPLSFAPSVADCALVAWIARDGVIDLWPAGGGATKRVGRGLAGPDMTLGTDAARAQLAGCSASSIVIGAEDTMSWGLVFDLATSVLGAPGSRASSAVLVSSATPGRKIALP